MPHHQGGFYVKLGLRQLFPVERRASSLYKGPKGRKCIARGEALGKETKDNQP